jgi:serine O-acetyltransferase
VVGVTGRVVKQNNVRIPRDEMDQVHLPDPVQKELSCLRNENICLRNELIRLYDKVEKMDKILCEKEDKQP